MLREYVELILVCVLFLIFVRAFVFQQSEIPTSSMENTILVGDYILVNRFVYAPGSEWERRLLPMREIQRGDIVVFKRPDTPEVDYIKRVVGVPGDLVAVRQGFLYVNGEAVEEPYVGKLYRDRSSFGPVQVEPGHFFMMGDHRNRSSDSRVWGEVPQELIKGRAFMVLFSTNAGRSDDAVSPKSLVRKIFNPLFRSRWDRSLTPLR